MPTQPPKTVTLTGVAFNCRPRDLETIEIWEGALAVDPGQDVTGTITLVCQSNHVARLRFHRLQVMNRCRVRATGVYRSRAGGFDARLAVAAIELL